MVIDSSDEIKVSFEKALNEFLIKAVNKISKSEEGSFEERVQRAVDLLGGDSDLADRMATA